MNVLICDDSGLARKSLHRSIGVLFEANFFFCENGREALDILSHTPIKILFLDLTMPVMDGFEVLDALSKKEHTTKIIVVSGDVQQEAKNRCLSLGAYGFLEKPFHQDTLHALLPELGWYPASYSESKQTPPSPQEHEIDPISKFKELSNVALGKGAAVISDRVGTFIQLPLPTVGILEAGELRMTVADALSRDSVHVITQRFVGGGIHGEALLCMRGDGIQVIGKKLGFAYSESNQHEVTLNVANLLISTYLNALSHQLVIDFSLRQPVALNRSAHERSGELNIEQGAFTIEFTYTAEQADFECSLLFFIDSESVDVIYQLMEHL